MNKADSQKPENARFSAVDLMLIGMSLVWGINFSIVKIAIADISPLAFNALRFTIASTILLVLLWVRERDLTINKGDMLRFIALALIGNTFYQLLFINGIARTTAGNSSLILATTPIFIVLLGSLLGIERVTKIILQSVILSFAGIILIVTGSGKPLTITNQNWIGDLLVLIGTICWSVYTVLSKPLLEKYTPLKLTALTMTFATPPLILAAIPSLNMQDWSIVSTTTWMSLAYSSSLAIAIGYVIWYTGVSHIGSARTSLYDNLVTVIAVAFAWVVLSESMTLIQIIGAALVFLSLYIARKNNRKQREST